MTTKNQFFLTADGLESLKAELDDLVNAERTRIAQDLKEAKHDGDLSENAAYIEARERQEFVEGRISELENIIKHSKVIESKSGGEVALGSTVHLELEDGTQKYTIVGSTEANPDEGKISNESPIGQALIGRKEGEEVHIKVPAGTLTYKIARVE